MARRAGAGWSTIGRDPAYTRYVVVVLGSGGSGTSSGSGGSIGSSGCGSSIGSSDGSSVCSD